MTHTFPSDSWTTALHNAINESSTYAHAARNWEGDILFVIDGHGAIHLDLWHGVCRSAQYLPDPIDVHPAYTISAPRDKWQRVLEGTLDPIQAMVTRQILLEGNLVQIMKNVKAAQELVRCATQVETTFI